MRNEMSHEFSSEKRNQKISQLFAKLGEFYKDKSLSNFYCIVRKHKSTVIYLFSLKLGKFYEVALFQNLRNFHFFEDLLRAYGTIIFHYYILFAFFF